MSLSYSSGGGNGSFGLGFNLSLPSIAVKTERGYPRYDESDEYILSGADDLVPEAMWTGASWAARPATQRNWNRRSYDVYRYRTRTEGEFARIERWVRVRKSKAAAKPHVFWRVLSKDGHINIYGRDAAARNSNPDAPEQISAWLLQETSDPKGNLTLYEYRPDPGDGGSANNHIWRIRYGPYKAPGVSTTAFHFEVVFDYSDRPRTTFADGRYEPDAAMDSRKDPGVTFRVGHTKPCTVLCRHILTYHRFGGAAPFLVRGVHLEYAEDPVLSRIHKVRTAGYRTDRPGKGAPEVMETPPLVLTFTPSATLGTLRPITMADGETHYCDDIAQIVDLHGTGTPGLLSRRGVHL